MQTAEAQYEIDGMDADDWPIFEQLAKDAERLPIFVALTVAGVADASKMCSRRRAHPGNQCRCRSIARSLPFLIGGTRNIFFRMLGPAAKDALRVAAWHGPRRRDWQWIGDFSPRGGLGRHRLSDASFGRAQRY